MEKSLEDNKALDKLALSALGPPLPREFCHHVLLGSRQNTSMSKLDLNFCKENWNCPNDGRLVYVHHMLCDSFGCGV